MSKIQFIKSETTQEGVVVSKASNAVIDVKFTAEADERDILGGFYILNEHNNKIMGRYTTYKTVYRKIDELHYQLSNDGSVYVPPVVKTEAKITFVGSDHLTLSFTEKTVAVGTDLADIEFPEVTSSDVDYTLSNWSRTEGVVEDDITIYAYERYEHIPTVDEVRVSKTAEMDASCESVIYGGVDVTMEDGTVEHFSLTEKDQLNLFGKQVQIASGAEKYEYHQDGKPCVYYNLADMTAIITSSMGWVTFHTTYVNALHMWIKGCETKEELEAIYYGAIVPDEYVGEVLRDLYDNMVQFSALVTAQMEASAQAQA